MVNVDSTFILQLSQAMCKYDTRMRVVMIHVWDIRGAYEGNLQGDGFVERGGLAANESHHIALHLHVHAAWQYMCMYTDLALQQTFTSQSNQQHNYFDSLSPHT